MTHHSDFLSLFPASAGPENPADIRTLTIAFMDIANSTQHAAEKDLEEYDSFLENVHAMIDSGVRSFGGTVMERWGDGALAVFGMVQDAEDAAAAAIKCALSITQHADRLCGAGIRAGLHSGAVVCRTGETPALPKRITGLDVTIAARLQEMAPINSVVISDETRAFTQRIASLSEFRATPFVPKGMSQTVNPLVVTGLTLRPASQNAKRALLGRQSALDALVSSGNLPAVRIISGPAGMGKTSLIEEIRQRKEGVSTLRLNARANLSRSSLFPCVELLRKVLNITDDGVDDLELSDESVEILRLVLRTSDADRAVLNHSPHQLRSLKISVVCDVFLQLQKRQPTLIIFDDIDLADMDSFEVIRTLIERGLSAHTQLILTARSEDVVAKLGLGCENILRLGGLESEAMEKLVNRIRPDLTSETRQHIFELSEGNPLFAEMLALSVSDRGDAGPKLPNSLTATMEARLRSFNSCADLIRIAAVLGRRFPEKHLWSFLPKEETIGQMDMLSFNRVFHRVGNEFEFDHLMLRDTAYNMMPRSQRKKLHAKAAQVLPRVDPEFANDYPEVIADHAIESGVPELVVPCAMTAGIAQLKNANFELALHYLNAASDAVQASDLPIGLAELSVPISTLLASAEVQSFGFAHPAVKQRYSELLALVRSTGGGNRQKMNALYGLFAQRMISGRVRACSGLLAEMDLVADPLKSGQQLLRYVNHAAYSLYRRDLDACLDTVKTVSELYNSTDHGQIFLEVGADPLLSVQSAKFYIHGIRGASRQVIECVHKSEDHANNIGAFLQIPWIRIFAAQSLFLGGDPDAAQDLLGSGLRLAEKQGGLFWILTGTLWRHVIDLDANPTDDNINSLLASIANLESIGANLSLPYAYSCIARANRLMSRHQMAKKWIMKAAHMMTCTGERLWAPYILDELSACKDGISVSYQSRAARLRDLISDPLCDTPHRIQAPLLVS